VRDLRVTYEKSILLDSIDLTVGPAEIVAVLGPSGIGKSTLLRAIAGLEPYTGSISWDGADLASVPAHKRGFALMFQDGQLFGHLTVARNVAYAIPRGRTRRAEVAQLLDLVGLAGFERRLPRTLSGGERQRVALARALAARPRLLLLDEPLSSLDRELRDRLAGDLARILRETGTAAILVTHDESEAETIADRVVRLVPKSGM
jgi:thiamine transport system ATP-binding protein